MKLPNGYGSVYKLGGNRRRPWAARKTTGYSIKPGAKDATPDYYFIGYFRTRSEALAALADYNRDPYAGCDATFAELYERWSAVYYTKISAGNVRAYKAAYKLLEPVHDRRVSELRIDDFQRIVDGSGKHTPTLSKLKTLVTQVYDYGVAHELVDPARLEVLRRIDISTGGTGERRTHTVFTAAQIDALWQHSDDDTAAIALMLIYSGMRIGEMLDLASEDVHDTWLDVRRSKTTAGIRSVPIADKVMPLYRRWLDRGTATLISTASGSRYDYANFLTRYWRPLMLDLDMQHTPHDTRHTCITMLTEAGVDPRIIKRIVGHAGSGVTEAVYTHIGLAAMLDAINKI